MALVTADAGSITADATLTADGFIGWPVQLPNPTIDGYGLEPADQVIRTDMEVGAPRTRRRSLADDDSVDVAWKFTDAQMKIFRDWWRTTAAGGAAWFDVNLAVGGGGIQLKEAKFNGKWKSTLLPGMNWHVTAKLEVR